MGDEKKVEDDGISGDGKKLEYSGFCFIRAIISGDDVVVVSITGLWTGTGKKGEVPGTFGTLGTFKSNIGGSTPSISDSPKNSGNKLNPSIGYASAFTLTGTAFAGLTSLYFPDV